MSLNNSVLALCSSVPCGLLELNPQFIDSDCSAAWLFPVLPAVSCHPTIIHLYPSVTNMPLLVLSGPAVAFSHFPRPNPNVDLTDVTWRVLEWNTHKCTKRNKTAPATLYSPWSFWVSTLLDFLLFQRRGKIEKFTDLNMWQALDLKSVKEMINYEKLFCFWRALW